METSPAPRQRLAPAIAAPLAMAAPPIARVRRLRSTASGVARLAGISHPRLLRTDIDADSTLHPPPPREKRIADAGSNHARETLRSVHTIFQAACARARATIWSAILPLS